MDIKKYKCTECGASLDIKDDMDTIYCSYCGTKNYIDDAASNITRVEKAKLKARKEFHNQNMQEKVDKINFIKTIFKKSEEEKKKETRFLIIFYSIFFLIMIVGITCAIIMAPKNPSLEAYNSLKLGMSYVECKEILNADGHLVSENAGKLTYVWYDVSYKDPSNEISNKSDIIIELKYEDDKLISRKENGLK